jgi:long-chain acyl-CoA synthetase
MQACGRKGGLGGIELIEGVVLSKEEWTPENGLVTPSQKLHRKNIVEKYKVQIKIAYDD